MNGRQAGQCGHWRISIFISMQHRFGNVETLITAGRIRWKCENKEFNLFTEYLGFKIWEQLLRIDGSAPAARRVATTRARRAERSPNFQKIIHKYQMT